MGWQLFENYVIALEKYQPDYFLYENNKSMAPAIQAQISRELGTEPVPINSALVSAQNRRRLYWVGRRNRDGTYGQVPVKQPEDRGVILRQILETVTDLKGYILKPAGKALSSREMAYMVRTTTGGRNHFDFNYHHNAACSKSSCITANMHKGVPYNVLVEPVRIGTVQNNAKNQHFDSQQYRVYSPEGKAVTLCGNGGGLGAKTGLYAAPLPKELHRRYAESGYPVYHVQNGCIVIAGAPYPIKLQDGDYIIRKLTVTECKRLQTVPEDYTFPVSDTQAYKMLGNGWTVDVIAHIMRHFPGLTQEPVEVLSMYDGMSCGHIALDKLGVNVQRYYATEIDLYAIKTTLHNYPGTIQLGDAFAVRDAAWHL